MPSVLTIEDLWIVVLFVVVNWIQAGYFQVSETRVLKIICTLMPSFSQVDS